MGIRLFRRKKQMNLEEFKDKLLSDIKGLLEAPMQELTHASRVTTAVITKMDNHAINFYFYIKGLNIAFDILSQNPDMLKEYYKKMSETETIDEVRDVFFNKQKGN